MRNENGSSREGRELEKDEANKDIINNGDSESNGTKEKEIINTGPFYKLFHFADSIDTILMIVGSIGAIGNGLCMPLMAILFGDLIDSFGQTQNNSDVVHVVSTFQGIPEIFVFGNEGWCGGIPPGILLDGDRREAGCKNKESIFENNIETRCRFL